MLESDRTPADPPAKKLKQARLHFLGFKDKTATPQPIAPKIRTDLKKRKHSDTESPTAKASKSSKQVEKYSSSNVEVIEVDEVSSSEPDHAVTQIVKPQKNTLMRYIRRGTSEDVITSTSPASDVDDAKENIPPVANEQSDEVIEIDDSDDNTTQCDRVVLAPIPVNVATGELVRNAVTNGYQKSGELSGEGKLIDGDGKLIDGDPVVSAAGEGVTCESVGSTVVDSDALVSDGVDCVGDAGEGQSAPESVAEGELKQRDIENSVEIGPEAQHTDRGEMDAEIPPEHDSDSDGGNTQTPKRKKVKIDNARSPMPLEGSTDEVRECSVFVTPLKAHPELRSGKRSPSTYSPGVVGTQSPEVTPLMGQTYVKGSQSTSSPNVATSQSPVTPGDKHTSKVMSAKKAERMAQRQRVAEEKERAQQALKDERRIQREEREREKKDKMDKLLNEKQEAKQQKDKERQELLGKREKERIERLDKLEDEKRKKQEIIDTKNEQKRKKDEEKKSKEDEKNKERDDEIMKKKKAQDKFQSFFTITKTSPVLKMKPAPSSCNFMPFELKGNMELAPLVRRVMTDEEKFDCDQVMLSQSVDELYLIQLKLCAIEPSSTGRTNGGCGDEQDLIMVGHDTDVIKTATHHVKFLAFHTNHRPPYYGTWSTRSTLLTPRNPWRKDTNLLDYEVDSDDEWEEEEPGESLSHSEGEDKEDEGEDDEEDAGWMVPHGYLSADEGCDDDEEVTVESLKMRQQAKLEAWETELKRKQAPVSSVVVGCCWDTGREDEETEEGRVFLCTYQVYAQLSLPINTTHSVITPPDSCEVTPKRDPSRLKQSVTEQAMPHVIRLVHGNTAGIARLVTEFRRQWSLVLAGKQESVQIATCSPGPDSGGGDSEKKDPTDGCVGVGSVGGEGGRECPGGGEVTESDGAVSGEGDGKPAAPGCHGDVVDESNCGISKNQLKAKIFSIAVREKRALYRKACWYVHRDVLAQYGLADLPSPVDEECRTPVRVSVVSPSPRSHTPTHEASRRGQPPISLFTTRIAPLSSPGFAAKTVKSDEALASPENVAQAPPGWLVGGACGEVTSRIDQGSAKSKKITNPLTKFFGKTTPKSEPITDNVASEENVDKMTPLCLDEGDSGDKMDEDTVKQVNNCETIVID